jgi:ADP-heptose:LPS heptosyltransferase
MRPRVLIVKLGAAGDVVLALPMLGAVRGAVPEAALTWVIGESCADLLRGHSALARLVVVDDRSFFARNPLARAAALVRILVALDHSYDLILVGHRDPAYAFALRPFVRGPLFQIVRAKTPRPARQVIVPALSVPEGEAMRRLVRAGLAALGHSSDFPWVTELSHLDVHGPKPPSPYAVLHAGGGANARTRFDLKQWPHATEFVPAYLAATKYRLVLVGGAQDRAIADRIMARLDPGQRDRIEDYVGRTSWPELAGLIRGARVFIGPDSGPLHLADALGVPAVGLFGPTSTLSWGLQSPTSRMLREAIECSPCYRDDGVFPPCPHQHRCMLALSPARVLDACLQLTVE